jgi:hypothetical protein
MQQQGLGWARKPMVKSGSRLSDTKQLARFERVGHCITGDRRQGCSRGAGYEKVHVAIDDACLVSIRLMGGVHLVDR